MYINNTAYAPLQKISITPLIVSASVVLIVVTGVRIAQTHEFFQTSVASAQAIQTAQASLDSKQHPAIKPTLEMHIANNGLALLRGARVDSIEGDTLRIAERWGSQNFTWTVQNSGTTKLFAANGEKLQRELLVGEYLTVSGTLDVDAQEPMIIAQFIRVAN